MTLGDKELLLKDLCARLPYGVKCKVVKYDTDGEMLFIRNGLELTVDNVKELITNNMYEIKPYLFPLSSMTEEQKKEFLSVAGYEAREEDCGRHTETYYYDMVGHEHNFYPNSDAIDWCIKNNFDYRGLIPKGLANDATGLNVY